VTATPADASSPSAGAETCPVCGKPTGGEHGTPAMAHNCEHPGCVFGPMHIVGYHFVNGQRVPAVPSPEDSVEPNELPVHMRAHDVLADALAEAEDDHGDVSALAVRDYLTEQGWTLAPTPPAVRIGEDEHDCGHH